MNFSIFFNAGFIMICSNVFALKTSVLVPCSHENFQKIETICNVLCYQTKIPDEVIIIISGSENIQESDIQKLASKKRPFRVLFLPRKEDLHLEELFQIGAKHATGDVFISQPIYEKNQNLPHPQRIEFIDKKFSETDCDVLFHSFAPLYKHRITLNKFSLDQFDFKPMNECDKNQNVDFENFCIRKTSYPYILEMKNPNDSFLGNIKTWFLNAPLMIDPCLD